MNRLKILLTSLTTLFVVNSFAQNNPGLTGTWKGTSICQVKNSPCHDENVVYHISETDSLNTFRVLANKIVDNKEEEMGIIIFTYESKHQTLTSIDKTANARWVFNLQGKQLKGTLVYNNNLYRVIDIKKEDPTNR